MNDTPYTIDATGKKIGRIATEAAKVLSGKHTPAYERHLVTGQPVRIENAGQLSVTDAKAAGKTYTRYSGWPSGLKTEKLADVIQKKGHGEALRRAIYGMLAGNKLRARIMKRLVIEE